MKFAVLSFVALGVTTAYGQRNMSLWSNCSSFKEVVDTCLGCPEKASNGNGGVCASHTYCKGARSTKTFATQCHVECESEWTMQDPDSPCAVSEPANVKTENTTLSKADQKELDVQNQLARFRHILELCEDGECIDGCNKRHCNCSAYVPTVPSTTAAPAGTGTGAGGGCEGVTDPSDCDGLLPSACGAVKFGANVTEVCPNLCNVNCNAAAICCSRAGVPDCASESGNCPATWTNSSNVIAVCAANPCNPNPTPNPCDATNFFCNTTSWTNSSGDRARRQPGERWRRRSGERWWWTESDCDDAKIALDQIKVECNKSAVASCTQYTSASEDYGRVIAALNDNNIDASSAAKAAVGCAMLAAAGVTLLAVAV